MTTTTDITRPSLTIADLAQTHHRSSHGPRFEALLHRVMHTTGLSRDAVVAALPCHARFVANDPCHHGKRFPKLPASSWD